MKTYNEDTKSGTTDKIEGNAKVAAGSVKQATGKVFHSPKLEERGIDEKVEGRVQKVIGDVKKSFDQ
jgi:uncharacterized protein YjbJ (UPF0337 family)